MFDCKSSTVFAEGKGVGFGVGVGDATGVGVGVGDVFRTGFGVGVGCVVIDVTTLSRCANTVRFVNALRFNANNKTKETIRFMQ
jgi:hypothetical protein